MMMEGREEVVVCKDQLQIIKGKRTKRPRPLSPLTLAMASSTTTSSGGESGGEGGRNSNDSRGFDRAVASPTTSVELAESTEEEEDMANCLILLAQGQTRKLASEPASLATASKTAGIYVHQCKTCNRCFPSFQALGGHRASHKKPKINNEENNKGLIFVKEDDHDQFNNMNTSFSLQITNKAAVLGNSNKSKVHECSICGAEFSSGQALGGHMRRHRTFTNAATTTATTTLSVGTRISSPEPEESKKSRTVLQLDLNLPAPEDDHHREPKLSFASKEKLLVFSASSLVDCHY
ncbi:zinc finger protein ZAT5-like [Durio zibethinus]|uniref:Zinc finger protein ZAT5-like n=1 Tax=Durio zibethinus TaxID=66656 RepID=A0A6P6AMM4_DURZI|nr:zinc finger protein ZAT5-like [Durio zibethinus]